MYNNTKLSNLLLISVSTFAASILFGYILYSAITGTPLWKQRKDNIAPTVINHTLPNDTVSAISETNHSTAEQYYLAKENQGKIGVYAYKDGSMQFLYNIDTLITSLTEDDKLLIRQGVVLYTREELASFEEDFSS